MSLRNCISRGLGTSNQVGLQSIEQEARERKWPGNKKTHPFNFQIMGLDYKNKNK